MDPQSSTKTDPPLFPSFHLPQKRASSLLPFHHSLYSLPLSLQALYARISSSFHAMPPAPRDINKPPPRPPNAWILYRSDKLRSLPPAKKGESRIQGHVSKIVSYMWNNESEQVRSEYERRADARKAQHQLMYPNYKFQPMKKEEKDRLKEKKKAEKESRKKGKTRSAPYSINAVGRRSPPAVPHPYAMPAYNPEARFGPLGPSPPVSAAPSPSDTSSPQAGPSESSYTHSYSASAQGSTHASPSPDAIPNSLSKYPLPIDPAYEAFFASLAQAPQPHMQTAQLPVPLMSQPPVAPIQWDPQQFMLPQPSAAAVTAPTPEWTEYDSSQSQPRLESQSSQSPEEFLSFDFSSFGNQSNILGWSPSNPGDEFIAQDSMQALLSATGDPSIFQLDDFDPQMLLANPLGELEVAMGPQPQQLLQSYFDSQDLFGNFDLANAFADAPSLSQELQSATIDPRQTLTSTSSETSTQDIASLFTTNAPESVKQRQVSMFTQEVMQYLNFEAMEGAGSSTQQDNTSMKPSPPHHRQLTPVLEPVSTNTYVQSHGSSGPSAGVIHSSARRVASNWKHPVIQESPLEHASQCDPWNLVHGLVVSSAVSLVLFSSARSSIVVIVIPIHPSSIHPLPSSPVLLPSPSTIVAPAVPVVATSPKGLSHYQR
ncbi:hypothetical protein SERLADRAFT_437126 [Serpula lacrymans var. lacrymans S7.9]|uniref:HMG box domain-containing protein n=2 Tax=Serpula lacrymans var. lacrymans TaxID=341189 RepID=F8NVG2_SERL9|nr:uncharacterized protein SERLADRAFT_437126 [Serpula lacrymans var. lacrymans S7.9]EGO25371.1 hypothetical protein SERLADRAFT_437126 [Serpula lacrymans var. lacrymans S7.9]